MAVSRKNLNKKKKNANFRNVFNNTGGRNGKLVLYNPLSSMPDEFDTVIKSFGTSLSAAATASVQITLFSNSLLHSSDSFGSGMGTSSTLTNLASNYTKYRVVAYNIEYTVVSRSTSETNFVTLHSPTALTYSSASSFQAETVTRDKALFYFVPANTKSPCVQKMRQGFRMSQIIGEREFQTADSYVGTLSSSGVPTDPSDLTYIYFYMGLASAAAFTAGTAPAIAVTMTQYVKFYDKRV
jgi:hypothetical protein